MGIAGLQGFLERRCEHNGGFSKVNFGQLVRDYRERNNKDPIVVFDTASCVRHIYSKGSDDFLCGGQLKQYIELFEQFYQKITDLGVECVFFTDGSPPPERLEIWTKRREDEYYEKIYLVIQLLSDNLFDEAEQKAQDIRPISLFAVLLSYMQARKIKIIQTVSEADDEIMQFISDNSCLALIGQDSDFAVCEGIEHYLSIQHFNMREMTTRSYSAAVGLGNLLSVGRREIPLLATLCGNDIISSQMLRPFHLRLLSNERNSQRFYRMDFLPRGAVIPRLSEWIQRHIRRDMSAEEMATKASIAVKCPEKMHLFLKSIKSYQLPPKTIAGEKYEPQGKRKRSQSNDDDPVAQNWAKIVERIDEMFRHEHLSHLVHCVVTRCAGFFSVPTQFHIKPDHPPTAQSARTLRQRMYGILLKERPKSSDKPLQVEEYIFSQPGQTWPSLLDPIYPDNHPGLLKLWSDEAPVDEKWRLFCWAVSDKISPQQVLKLSPPLQVPALALFYMLHEAKLKVQRWEVEALVAHVVRLKETSAQELSSMKVRPHSALAVHLANGYQVVCMLIYSVAASCGYPTSLHQHPGFFFFDGKLFQHIYAELSRGGGATASKCCGTRPEHVAQYMELIQFLYHS